MEWVYSLLLVHFTIKLMPLLYFFLIFKMLVPATVEDLKSAGKITVSPNYDPASNGSPIKAVQIKVLLIFGSK